MKSTSPSLATVTNAQAALRWLKHSTAGSGGGAAGACLRRQGRHSRGEVIGRIRDLVKKAPPRKDRLEINGAIREVIELTRGEAVKNGVSVQVQLAEGLPLIRGDRVQLQQVILNLIINAIEAMSGVSDGLRELLISTGNADPEATCSSPFEIRAPDLRLRRSNMFSRPSTRPSRTVWGMGLVDLPFDHRSARRTIVGERERTSRSQLSIHGASLPRSRFVMPALDERLPQEGEC